MSRRAHYRNAYRTLRPAARRWAPSRSSTRTTPSPPTRSASATTTGSPPWSPTSSTPTCWSCCPTWTASTTATRARPGTSRIARGARPGGPRRRRASAAAGSAGVGTGGMVTKVEAARIATAAGIPVVLTSRRRRRATPWPGEPGRHAASTRPGRRSADPAAVAGARHHARGARCTSTPGRCGPSWSAASRCCRPASTRRRRASSSAGDPVDLVDDNGHAVARGLVNFDATEIPDAARPLHPRTGRELGPAYEREVVHRDDLGAPAAA